MLVVSTRNPNAAALVELDSFPTVASNVWVVETPNANVRCEIQAVLAQLASCLTSPGSKYDVVAAVKRSGVDNAEAREMPWRQGRGSGRS
jgi:hypothetical protein